jgi:hypothetical protein
MDPGRSTPCQSGSSGAGILARGSGGGTGWNAARGVQSWKLVSRIVMLVLVGAGVGAALAAPAAHPSRASTLSWVICPDGTTDCSSPNHNQVLL